MEVHHRLAELAFELGRYNPPPNATSTTQFARPHLELLLKVNKEGKLPDSENLDGSLCFFLGRCQEDAGDYVAAVEVVSGRDHQPRTPANRGLQSACDPPSRFRASSKISGRRKRSLTRW